MNKVKNWSHPETIKENFPLREVINAIFVKDSVHSCHVNSVLTGSESVSYMMPAIWELITSELTQKKFIAYGADFI